MPTSADDAWRCDAVWGGRTARNAVPVDPAIRTTHKGRSIIECEVLTEPDSPKALWPAVMGTAQIGRTHGCSDHCCYGCSGHCCEIKILPRRAARRRSTDRAGSPQQARETGTRRARSRCAGHFARCFARPTPCKVSQASNVAVRLRGQVRLLTVSQSYDTY